MLAMNLSGSENAVHIASAIALEINAIATCDVNVFMASPSAAVSPSDLRSQLTKANEKA